MLTATILPAVCAVMWVLSALYRLNGSHNGRLGRIALGIATIGLLGLVVDSVVTLTSGSTDTVGPLYPVAMLTSVIGITGLAIAWYRSEVLPRWTGPTLALGWFLGATPVLGSGGAFLILAAAFLAIAVGLRRSIGRRPSRRRLSRTRHSPRRAAHAEAGEPPGGSPASLSLPATESAQAPLWPHGRSWHQRH